MREAITFHAHAGRPRWRRQIVVAVASLAVGAFLSPVFADAAHKSSGPQLFASGSQPADATVFRTTGPHRGDAYKTIDANARTAWIASASGRGVMVDPIPGGTDGVGVVSQTKGWSVEVWFSNRAHPSSFNRGHGDGWAFVGEAPASGRDRLDVAGVARHAKHFLVWVKTASGPVHINEIQLFE